MVAYTPLVQGQLNVGLGRQCALELRRALATLRTLGQPSRPPTRKRIEMNYPPLYLTKSIFLVTCFAVGCTGGGSLGCGSSDGGPTVDSQLPGVYQIDRYQVTPTDEASQDDPDICDQLSDSDPPPAYLVLYSFRPNDDLEEARLGGVFCADVDQCREIAREAPEPVLGYSFSAGDDASGWLGWGIQSSGQMADQCRVDVRAHTLTSASAKTIDIQTRTVRTVFPPAEMDGNNVTCRIADAIASLNDDLPCIGAFSLEATFEAGL